MTARLIIARSFRSLAARKLVISNGKNLLTQHWKCNAFQFVTFHEYIQSSSVMIGIIFTRFYINCFLCLTNIFFLLVNSVRMSSAYKPPATWYPQHYDELPVPQGKPIFKIAHLCH